MTFTKISPMEAKNRTKENSSLEKEWKEVAETVSQLNNEIINIKEERKIIEYWKHDNVNIS